MKTTKPLLSILIATKDREKYCIAAIESLLPLTTNGLVHIAISDNSSTNTLQYFIEKIDCPLISYCYTEEPLSLIDNFNKVISLTKGLYICLIGDDDSVLPQIIDYTKWAFENNIDSFAFKHINYNWPKEDDITKNGRLEINTCFSMEKKVVIPQIQLIKLIENGFINYLDFHLPKLYHGIVKMSLMEKIKGRTGYYFGGLTPDIYSSVALSTIIEKHYEIDFPLSIAGACPQSGTNQNLTGVHSGKLENAFHFKGREFYEWNMNIPKIYSVETIWADSAVTALKDMGYKRLLEYFNQYKLIVFCIWNNKKWILKFSVIKMEEFRKLNNHNYFLFYFNICASLIVMFLNKIFRKIYFRKIQAKKVIYNVHDINQASSIISSYLNKN